MLGGGGRKGENKALEKAPVTERVPQQDAGFTGEMWLAVKSSEAIL